MSVLVLPDAVMSKLVIISADHAMKRPSTVLLQPGITRAGFRFLSDSLSPGLPQLWETMQDGQDSRAYGQHQCPLSGHLTGCVSAAGDELLTSSSSVEGITAAHGSCGVSGPLEATCPVIL